MVDRYAPEAGRDQIPTSEHSLAMLENNDIMAGQQVIVGVDQPHAIHWLVHLPMLMQIAQAFMKQPEAVGANIMTMVQAMGIGLQHLADHLKPMLNDKSRKGQTDMMEAQLDQLTKVFAQMQKSAQKFMQAQQQQQQQQQQQVQQAQDVLRDRDFQAKMAEIEGNLAVKMRNMVGQQQIRAEKAKHGMALADLKTAAELERENVKAGATPKPAE